MPFHRKAPSDWSNAETYGCCPANWAVILVHTRSLVNAFH